MEGAIYLKADRAGLSHNDLARWITRQWLALNIAQVDQMLVHVNLTALLLIVLLDAPEEIV